MNTIWFPAPVIVFFRRLFNAAWTLSVISRQYQSPLYLQVSPDSPDSEGNAGAYLEKKTSLWDTVRMIQWPSWSGGALWRLALSKGLSDSRESVHRLKQASTEIQHPFHSDPQRNDHDDAIHQLMNNPVLYEPLRKPRYPVALCHGLYGFDVRGPSAFPLLQKHYWSNALSILRDTVGAEVIVTSVPSTGSIESRSASMDRALRQRVPGRGINFIAHSMGGLDCRHLISHIKPREYTPLSLTSIATPHRGSPFMDWCQSNIGLGKITHTRKNPDKADALGQHTEDIAADVEAAYYSAYHSALKDEQRQHDRTRNETTSSSASPSSRSSLLSLASLPSSFTTLLLSLLDSPAYANLTSAYLMSVFNPSTPNDPGVKYFSVAGRVSGMSVWHPLWLPKMVLDQYEEKQREAILAGEGDWSEGPGQGYDWGNDGLVTVESARWGEFLGVLEGCDHWAIRGARGIEVELPAVSVPSLRLGLGRGDEEKGTEKTVSADGWGLADWTRFAKAWKKEEKENGVRESARAATSTAPVTAQAGVGAGGSDGSDEVVKSSTDKLSAVFDWIVEQAPRSLPIPGLSSSSSNTSPADSPSASNGTGPAARKQAERNDLASKMDLERFYVALCRKLYDEGL